MGTPTHSSNVTPKFQVQEPPESPDHRRQLGWKVPLQLWKIPFTKMLIAAVTLHCIMRRHSQSAILNHT
jgi:hypothetical protein